MKTFRFLLVLLMVPSLLLVSCKKDKDEPEVPEYKQPLAASRTEVVVIPEGLQAKADEGDLNASIAVMYMGMANAISSFGSSFTVPTDAQIEGKKGSSVVYHWSYGGYSYWMTFTEYADKYTWEYEYEFPNYPRFTYILAEEMKDGKSGGWTIYDPENSAETIWTYTWSVNSSNTFTADLTWNAGENETSSFNVVANANNSGSFKFYEVSVLQAEVNWNADGSGTFWLIGPPAFSGSWTAK